MRYKRPLGLLTVFMASACSEVPEDAELSVAVEERPTFDTSWSEFQQTAKSSDDGSGSYLVEWDMVVSGEKALRSYYADRFEQRESKLAVFQRSSTGFEPTYSRLDALDIVYCVATTFTNHATVVSDMATATRAWQRVVNVRFRYNAAQNASCNQSNTNVDFAVMPTTRTGLFGCASNKLGWAALNSMVGCQTMDGGALLSGVLLMQYGLLPGTGALSGATAVGVMRHELGHMLGFRHEHPWAPSNGGCGETPTVTSVDLTGRRLTAAYDQRSVMHYPQCAGISGADFSISANDKLGARKIYKVPAAFLVPISGS